MLKIKEQCSSLINDLREGFVYTIPYLLSHHEPHEYYRCITVSNTKVCARCLGIYTGIAITLILNLFFYLVNLYFLILIAILPIGVVIDWSLSNLRKLKSNNFIRISSGFLLGVAVALGIVFLLNGFFEVIIILFFYFLVTILLVYIKTK